MSIRPHPSRTARARATAAAQAPDAWSALLFSTGGLLWLIAMGPRLEAEALFGPICSGHVSLFALHCPACYAGAALAAAGALAAARRLASGGR